MESQHEVASENGIVLDENPGITEVSTLYETLKCLLATDQDVELDASRVKSIDTASLQLLAAYSNKFENLESNLIWIAQSDKFCNTARLLGLHESLDCEV